MHCTASCPLVKTRRPPPRLARSWRRCGGPGGGSNTQTHTPQGQGTGGGGGGGGGGGEGGRSRGQGDRRGSDRFPSRPAPLRAARLAGTHAHAAALALKAPCPLLLPLPPKLGGGTLLVGVGLVRHGRRLQTRRASVVATQSCLRSGGGGKGTAWGEHSQFANGKRAQLRKARLSG